MQTATSVAEERAALTDLYRDGKFIVNYPGWLVWGLGVSGIAAFALIGFLGYPSDPAFLGGIFVPRHGLIPIATFAFVWLCAVIMTLQYSIMRHPAFKGERIASLTVTAISMVIVAFVYHFGPTLPGHPTGPGIPWDQIPTYAIINYSLLAVFWVDTIRRWVLRAQGKPLFRQVDLLSGRSMPGDLADEPALNDLVSGDLVAGGGFMILLAIIFTPSVVNLLADAHIGVHIGACLPLVHTPGPCVTGGATPADPRSLSFVDVYFGAICLIFGPLILGLSAFSRGFAKGPQGVVDEVVKALRTAFKRPTRIVFRSVALKFRHVVWPLLILLGVTAAGFVAFGNKNYLHLVAAAPGCHVMTAPLTCTTLSWTDQFNGLFYQFISLAGGLVAAFAITGSAALLIFNRRVLDNSLLFMGQVGINLALIFWLLSLVLSAINLVLWLPNQQTSWPFPQPSFVPVASFVVFLVWLIRRKPGQAMPDIGRMTRPKGSGAE